MIRWTIDACEDCYMATRGLYEPGGRPDSEECNPLSLFDSGLWTFTDGCLDCDDCDCAYCVDNETGATLCRCTYYGGNHGFSKWPCEGCGSPFAGNRYPLIVEEKP